jgi:NitT/TauT family transport system substrate-binding protein
MDAKKVNWVTVEATQKIPLLLAGKVDATAVFVTTGDPILARETPKLGGHHKISYADHGVDIYSNGITTTDKFIEENPGTVRGFVQATVKAYEFSFAQPEETVRIFVKHQPHLSPDMSRAHLEAVRGIVLTPATRANGIGWAVEEKMRRTRDITLSAYSKTAEVPLQDIYTNQFLR